jgi:ABC-type dipeptide/oligopeptide/nickel transport system permease component
VHPAPPQTQQAKRRRGRLGEAASAVRDAKPIGNEPASQLPVRELIGAPLLNTLILGAIALLVVTLLSPVFGLLTGSRPDAEVDRVR